MRVPNTVQPDLLANRARIWRNVFLAAAAAIAAQLPFTWGRVGVLIVSAIIVAILLAGAVISEARHRRFAGRQQGD